MPNTQEQLMELASLLCTWCSGKGSITDRDHWSTPYTCSKCNGTGGCFPLLRTDCPKKIFNDEIDPHTECSICSGQRWTLTENIKGGDVIMAMAQAEYDFQIDIFTRVHVRVYRRSTHALISNEIGEDFDTVTYKAAWKAVKEEQSGF